VRATCNGEACATRGGGYLRCQRQEGTRTDQTDNSADAMNRICKTRMTYISNTDRCIWLYRSINVRKQLLYW
jgi:hypothetical protein